jgi:competence CoiA-like predicted nuclease
MNKRAIEIFPEFLVYIFSDRANPPSPSFGETKQDYTQATKCGKFSKADLDVTKDIQEKNLENIFTKYRAFDKKIYFFFQKGEQSIRVKITEMNYTGPTGVEITKVLPESRKEISLSDFENSFGKLHLE